jgi:hypothetical protein
MWTAAAVVPLPGLCYNTKSLGASAEPETAIKAVQAVLVSHIWEVQDE